MLYNINPVYLTYHGILYMYHGNKKSELIVMFKKPVWDDLSFVTVHYPAGSTSEDGTL